MLQNASVFTMKEIIQLVFDSKLDNIAKVEQAIDDIKENYPIEDTIYGNMMIASIEAVTNAIEHGNSFDDTKNVSFRAFISRQSLKISVEDEGEGFNADTLPDPTTVENKIRPDGRGVFLMRNLADEIKFENNGTRVELLFRLN
jgi:serine/threonine-protein kinase RsbW